MPEYPSTTVYTKAPRFDDPGIATWDAGCMRRVQPGVQPGVWQIDSMLAVEEGADTAFQYFRCDRTLFAIDAAEWPKIREQALAAGATAPMPASEPARATTPLGSQAPEADGEEHPAPESDGAPENDAHTTTTRKRGKKADV